MDAIGLDPGVGPTGKGFSRGSITKVGGARLGKFLVDSAWTIRFPPRTGRRMQGVMARVPPKVREIAWKAQSRLTARFRAFAARGKKLTVACTAIARELAGFMWAVAREVQPQSKSA